jgi:hypothetical protein
VTIHVEFGGGRLKREKAPAPGLALGLLLMKLGQLIRMDQCSGFEIDGFVFPAVNGEIVLSEGI